MPNEPRSPPVHTAHIALPRRPEAVHAVDGADRPVRHRDAGDHQPGRGAAAHVRGRLLRSAAHRRSRVRHRHRAAGQRVLALGAEAARRRPPRRGHLRAGVRGGGRGGLRADVRADHAARRGRDPVLRPRPAAADPGAVADRQPAGAAGAAQAAERPGAARPPDGVGGAGGRRRHLDGAQPPPDADARDAGAGGVGRSGDQPIGDHLAAPHRPARPDAARRHRARARRVRPAGRGSRRGRADPVRQDTRDLLPGDRAADRDRAAAAPGRQPAVVQPPRRLGREPGRRPGRRGGAARPLAGQLALRRLGRRARRRRLRRMDVRAEERRADAARGARRAGAAAGRRGVARDALDRRRRARGGGRRAGRDPPRLRARGPRPARSDPGDHQRARPDPRAVLPGAAQRRRHEGAHRHHRPVAAGEPHVRHAGPPLLHAAQLRGPRRRHPRGLDREQGYVRGAGAAAGARSGRGRRGGPWQDRRAAEPDAVRGGDRRTAGRRDHRVDPRARRQAASPSSGRDHPPDAAGGDAAGRRPGWSSSSTAWAR